MSDAPRVSVLVPIMNVEPYLRQCLQSLVDQTLADIEIILIDDGSTDGSPAIIDEFAAADDRIVVLHKPNSGYGDSMNKGLDLARGEWIGIIEPDDWAEPTMFEHLLTAAVAHTGVDIAKASYMRETHAEQGTTEPVPAFYLHVFNPPCQPFTLAQDSDFLLYHPSIWTCIYRKSFLDEFNIRFLPIPGAGWADNPFFVETMVAARSIAYVDEALYHYREFEDGTFSHLKNWHVIPDRWAEMCDVIARYNVSDTGILEGHYCRGCAYIEMLDHDWPEDKEVHEAIMGMVATIDHEIVGPSRRIIEPFKDAYYKYAPFDKPTQPSPSFWSKVKRKLHLA